MERIEKKSSDFRGTSRCSKLREYDFLNLDTQKNTAYDNALIVKDIVKGYFKGDFQLGEFEDLVSQGIEDNFETEMTGKERKEILTKCLTRYCSQEQRKPVFGDRLLISVGDYDIWTKPDLIFADIKNRRIELVLLKAGKPNVVMRGKKRDRTVNQCLELYFLLLYGREYAKSLFKNGEVVEIIASYYFLKTALDKGTYIASDFFTGSGKNIAYLNENIIVGKSMETDYDKSFAPQLEQFTNGTECTEEECVTCKLNALCKYQKTPDVYVKKTSGSKNGKIIPSCQQQAIIDFRKGYCRVNATAGSGKTECMTERGARMIAEGTNPENILFITFTDAGALEMKERIIKKLQARNIFIDDNRIQAMTFNTFAYRIVRDKYLDLGFTKMPQVIDDVRNRVIITQMLEENIIAGLDYLNFSANSKNCKGALICAETTFNIMKAEGYTELNEREITRELDNKYMLRFMTGNAVTQIVSLYADYQKRLLEDNLLTFADQEPYMNKILAMYPGYLDRYNYEHVIVDEFQDSNNTQLNTIYRLMQCPAFKSLMVVGDDSQSIYGFRHTSPENILHFFDKLGIKDGIDLYLVENRRCTPEISELANKINDLNEEKVCKSVVSAREHGEKPVIAGFHEKDDEYEFITNKIVKYIKEDGIMPEDIAFIAAKKTELMEMASRLSKAGIPFVMKNPMTLVDNSRVKAALSLADAFYEPDITVNYFNYLVARYDGEIFTALSNDDLQALIEDMKKRFKTIDSYSIGYQRVIFHQLLDAIKGNDEVYEYFLTLLYANEDLPSELEYIRNFKKYGTSVAKKMEQSYQGVVLTTAHSSKGLEWKIVFNSISGYDSEYLHEKKRAKEVEEKRRLLFVSMTRARDILYVTGQYVTKNSMDNVIYNQFLKEVMEASGMVYNPIDYDKDLRKLQKENEKTKAKIAEATKKMNIKPMPVKTSFRSLLA